MSSTNSTRMCNSTGLRIGRRLGALALVTVVVAMAGCSADDVEFNGKIFDAVGLSGGATKAAEPKLAARAPLVMPPSTGRVPEPGEPAEAQSAEMAALNDPDQKAKTSEAELQKQQAAYCKVHYEEAMARGDNNADLAAGPLGPCRGSVVTAIQKWTKGDDE